MWTHKKVAKVVNKNLDEKLSGYGSKSIINFTATLGTDDGGRVGNILSGALEVLADINIDFKYSSFELDNEQSSIKVKNYIIIE